MVEIDVFELTGAIDIEKPILSLKTVISEIVEIDHGKEACEKKGTESYQEDNLEESKNWS